LNIFCKYEWEAEDALKRAKEILERELKLKLSPEKTKIVHGKETGVEFWASILMEDGRNQGIKR